MASIHLQGTLIDSLGEIDVGAIMTFTHLTNTGETIATTKVDLIIPPDGSYSIDVEYGQVRIDYTTRFTERFIATVIVNQDSTATSIPELLNAAVPVTDPVILEMQTILADAVTAETNASGFADDAEQSAIDAAASAASVDWLAIRYSKLDNPLTHVLKRNKLVETLSGALTWARATNATYIDRYGVLQTAAIDEPREEVDGWLIEGPSTNLFLNSAVGVTQAITISNGQDYTVSMREGAGSITLSGGGTGVVTLGSDVTFTASSTSVVLTVSGQAGLVQAENLPFASSYIPTTVSSVTRAADSVTVNGVNNISLLSTANSISLNVKTLGFNTSNQGLYSSTADDNLNRSASYWNGSNQKILSYISGSNRGFDVPVSRESHNSIVTTYDGSKGDSYANGVLERSDTFNYTDTSDVVSAIYIGRSSGGSEYLFGHINDFRVYDFALNAAEVSFLNGE